AANVGARPPVESRVRLFLRILGWILAIMVLAVGGVLYWFVLRPLPQVTGTISVPGLSQEVLVERDNWGVPHIRAQTVEDMAEAQGYVVAQDRLWQMDLLRRVSRGQLSEIVGPAALPVDKEFRQLRFSQAAERDVEQMDPDARRIM